VGDMTITGEEKHLFSQAVKVWGQLNELLQFIQEAAEAQQAATKFLQNDDGFFPTLDKLAEELGHLSIMTQAIIYQLDLEDKVNVYRRHTLVKLEARINNAKKS